jgi:hypothetical protein
MLLRSFRKQTQPVKTIWQLRSRGNGALQESTRENFFHLPFISFLGVESLHQPFDKEENAELEKGRAESGEGKIVFYSAFATWPEK